MQIIWDESPITAGEVVRRLEPETDWNHRTIRTMLNRLVNKGALKFKVDGIRYLYRPKVKRESYVSLEAASFVERVFCGDPASLLAHFVDQGDLSSDELRELKRLLTQKIKQSEV
jgi:predicted transcriptional regulator